MPFIPAKSQPLFSSIVWLPFLYVPSSTEETFQVDITQVFIYRSYSEGDVLSPARHQFTEYTLLWKAFHLHMGNLSNED